MKSLTPLLGIMSIVVSCVDANAQAVTVKSGKWSSPSTWSSGVVPNFLTGSITIDHKVYIPADTFLTVDELILHDTLIVEERAIVTLNHSLNALTDLQITTGGLKVSGKIICSDNAIFSGTSPLNTFFNDGSFYEHRYTASQGIPPVATWRENSTLEITGYSANLSLNLPAWVQAYGNVIYDCPLQTAFIELLGNIQEVQGNFIIRNTNGGVLRLTLDRTEINTINIGGNFIIEGNSEVWLSRAANTVINVAGNFEYRSTATASSYLTTKGICQLNVEGSVLVNSGLLRFASVSGGVGTLRVKKNLNFPTGRMAAVTPGQGFIECNGTTPQTAFLFGTLEETISFVSNNTTGVTLSSNSITNGNVLVKSGSILSLPSGSVTLGGNFSAESGASIVHNLGTVQLTGATNQSLNLFGNTLHHVNVNKVSGSTVTLTSPLNVLGTVTINSQNTDLLSNGNLTLLSTNDDGNGDASVASLPNGSSVDGNVTVQRFMQGEGRIYRYISMPVSSASIESLKDDFPITGTFDDPSSGAGISSNTPSFFYYDETLIGAQGWINYPSSGLAQNNLLIAGKGYSAFIREGTTATTWDVTGLLNQGEINMNVTYANSNDLATDGWNLVGNPYAASINWNITAGWSKVNVENEIAIRNNGLGTFLYWDGSIGSMNSGRIAKGQAFWIQTNGANPLLTINENAKADTTSAFHRKILQEPDFLEIGVESSASVDKTYLRLRSGATTGYEAMDVPKLYNDFINLSLKADSIVVAIAATDVLDCINQIPLTLAFKKKSDGAFIKSPIGNYTLSFGKHGLFSFSKIWLHDKFVDARVEITTSLYDFIITDDPASFREDRFNLLSEAPLLNDSLTVNHPAFVCDNVLFKIQLQNIQLGVLYSIHVNNNEAYTFLNSTEHSLDIELDPTLFLLDTNYVTIISRNACYQKEIDFAVTRFKEPVITELNGALLSNYTDGNHWFYEGEEMNANSMAVIIPDKSGNYNLKLNIDGCEGSADYNFIYQGHSLHFFPNPVDENLFIIAPIDQSIKEVRIVNTAAQNVSSYFSQPAKKIDFPVSNLSAGIYFLEVITDGGRYVQRFVKK